MTNQSAPTITHLHPLSSKRVVKLHFTKKNLDAIPVPNKQRYWSEDSSRYLQFGISPSGKRTFRWYRKVNRRPETLKIGNYPETTIEMAQRKADELNGRVASGENPAEERRDIRSEDTLQKLFDKFVNDYGKLRKKTWKQDEGIYNQHLVQWKDRRIGDITHEDVERLHESMKATPYMANRTVELLCAMYNRNIRKWGWRGVNPASAITDHEEESRSRFIDESEFPKFWEAVLSEPNTTVRDFVLMSIFTAARRGNVQQMQWSEIDMNAATWRIPKAKTKNRQELLLPLVTYAMEILSARRRTAKTDYVFANEAFSNGHIDNTPKPWPRIVKRAGLDGLRLHDLRRTNATVQGRIDGVSDLTIQRTLGHSNKNVTEIYRRTPFDLMRASMQSAADLMVSWGPDTRQQLALGMGNG